MVVLVKGAKMVGWDEHDPANGIRPRRSSTHSPRRCAGLRDKALELYPDSASAKDYRRSHTDWQPRPAEDGDGPWPGTEVEHSAGALLLIAGGPPPTRRPGSRRR